MRGAEKLRVMGWNLDMRWVECLYCPSGLSAFRRPRAFLAGPPFGGLAFCSLRSATAAGFARRILRLVPLGLASLVQNGRPGRFVNPRLARYRSPSSDLAGHEQKSQMAWGHLAFLVGAAGFEPTTFCSRSKRATGLRYAPTI